MKKWVGGRLVPAKWLMSLFGVKDKDWRELTKADLEKNLQESLN